MTSSQSNRALLHGFNAATANRRMRLHFTYVLFPMPAAFAFLTERFADDDIQYRFAIPRLGMDFELGNV